jgi:hypothetical protein
VPADFLGGYRFFTSVLPEKGMRTTWLSEVVGRASLLCRMRHFYDVRDWNLRRAGLEANTDALWLVEPDGVSVRQMARVPGCQIARLYIYIYIYIGS